MSLLKVLWVEDSTVYRRSAATVLCPRTDFEVTVCSLAGLSAVSATAPRDVTVIDAVNCAAGLQSLAEAVKRAAAEGGVVILGREDLLGEHAELIRAGALGYVTHGASGRDVRKAVRAAAKGEMWVQKGLGAKLVAELQGVEEYRGTAEFTNREQQVLAGVVNGKVNKEIAASLGCSERTVKGHVVNLRRKTGTSNRSSLAIYAVKNGLAGMR